MKRLVVIAEGETEESFVNNILIPYFNSLGIYNYIQCFICLFTFKLKTKWKKSKIPII